MDPDAEEASGNAIKLPSFVYIIDVLYNYGVHACVYALFPLVIDAVL